MSFHLGIKLVFTDIDKEVRWCRTRSLPLSNTHGKVYQLQRSVSMGMVREADDAPTPSREGNRLSLLLSGYASPFLSYQVKHRFSSSTAFMDLGPCFLWMEPQTLFLFDNVAFFSLSYYQEIVGKKNSVLNSWNFKVITNLFKQISFEKAKPTPPCSWWQCQSSLLQFWFCWGKPTGPKAGEESDGSLWLEPLHRMAGPP